VSDPKYATKGSHRWLQVAVNEKPELLNQPLRRSLGVSEDVAIEWLFPVLKHNYWEYRDKACLAQLGVELESRALSDFWPARGPMWDDLARTADGQVLLVEAKAHLPELISPRCKASEPALKRIQASLREVQNDLAPRSNTDWSGIFYQYANRLAHLHLLRTQNKVKAHLVFVYFLNAGDVFGPATREGWLEAIRLVEGYLGVHKHKLSRYVHKLFVDVPELNGARASREATPVT
jgi:hypothetical protein